MNIHFNPLVTALRFVFERNNRVPDGLLPAQPVNGFSGRPAGAFTATWLGHSTLLLTLSGFRILTDPVLTKKVTPVGPSRFKHSLALTPDLLPPVDLVIISHDHYDHLNRATIEQIKDKTGTFALPSGMGKYLEDWGVAREKIVELDLWQSRETLPGLTVTATPARHFSGRGLFDRNHTCWASWVVQSPEFRVFFSGDSGYFDGFSAIGKKFGPFDMTFIECGAYDRAWHGVHMFPEETVQAHMDLGGRILHPIHWGTFNLALHPWYEPMERLEKAAARFGIPIATPMPGQTITPDDLGSAWWKPAMAGQVKKSPISP